MRKPVLSTSWCRNSRMGRLRAEAVDEANDVADGRDPLQIAVGKVEAEVVLDDHHRLQRVERIEAKVFEKPRVVRERGDGEAEDISERGSDAVGGGHCAASAVLSPRL